MHLPQVVSTGATTASFVVFDGSTTEQEARDSFPSAHSSSPQYSFTRRQRNIMFCWLEYDKTSTRPSSVSIPSNSKRREPREHTHQPRVPAGSGSLGNLIRLQEVSVLGEIQVGQREEAAAADRRESRRVGLGLSSGLDGLHSSGVVGVRGPFQVLEPVVCAQAILLVGSA